MKSSKSLQKRIAKTFSEQVSSFDLFYQLTYMSATAAAGISRARVFELARQLPCPSAQYFGEINDLVENLRYNYSDACRMVGEDVKTEETKTFLLRLSDALRSGEPLDAFLAREARVQGENYSNEYERLLDSLKQWNDGYTAVTVSMALIVIINMVSTMIYDLGMTAMMVMVMLAVASGFGAAWIISRAAPQEVMDVPLAEGSRKQRLSLKLVKVFAPLSLVVALSLALLGVGWGWILISASLLLLPPGIVSQAADTKTSKKDREISSFLRSLGGTATSRGSTLTDALDNIKIDSFPTLQPDIRTLDLRLKAFGKPTLCWQMFGIETGSNLVNQTSGVFYEAVNLGGDPETVGVLSSLFAMKTAMLRAKRKGVAATFSWLIVIMHGVLTGLMLFLLKIVSQFAAMLETAMTSFEPGEEAMATETLIFGNPQIHLLEQITIGMIIMIALSNAFAIVSSEGAHWLKMSFYLSILLFLSGICFFVVPPLVQAVM